MSPKVSLIDILNWVYNLPREMKRLSNWNNPKLCVLVPSHSNTWEAETRGLSEFSGQCGPLGSTNLFLKIKGQGREAFSIQSFTSHLNGISCVWITR